MAYVSSDRVPGHTPLVSVLMPAYNAEKFIGQSLKSLLDQTYENWELLVADDGSTDGTRPVIDAHEDARIRRFHQTANQGYLKTWNKLLGEATGKYITFLDADDVIHPDRIERLVGYLNDTLEVAICGTGIAFVTEDQRRIGERLYPSAWEDIQQSLYDPSGFPFCGSAVMIRRQVAEAVGGYRPFFDRAGWEDHDWLIRCCERFKAANIPEILYYYRQNPVSVSRSLDVSPSSIRKLVIKKIGLELARQRRQHGRDFLMNNDSAGLQALIDTYESPYTTDPSRIYRVLSSRALKEGNLRTGWEMAIRSVQRNYLRPSNYLAVIRALTALVSS